MSEPDTTGEIEETAPAPPPYQPYKTKRGETVYLVGMIYVPPGSPDGQATPMFDYPGNVPMSQEIAQRVCDSKNDQETLAVYGPFSDQKSTRFRLFEVGSILELAPEVAESDPEADS